MNQKFTYAEQQKDIHGFWTWIKRALRGQIASSSALVVTEVITFGLKYGFNANPYLAQGTGIVLAFLYNYLVSKYFVFRPVKPVVVVVPSAEHPVEEGVLNASQSDL